MQKLVVTEPLDFSSEQLDRLKLLTQLNGIELERAAGNPTRDEWIEMVGDAQFALSGKQGLSTKDASGATDSEGIYDASRGLKIAHPFVNVAWVNKERLADKDITLTYAPGCNRDAVAEWVINAALDLFRQFALAINKEEVEPRLMRTQSLKGKNMTILGKGAVGTRVGELAEAFKMNVKYLERSGSIEDAVAGADVVVNCLSSSKGNHGLLDSKFFTEIMPTGSVFISMTNPVIYDISALLEAIGKGKLRGAGIDVGNSFPGDTSNENYKKYLDFINENAEFKSAILVTPQIAHFSDDSQRISFDMAIENLEYAVQGNLESVGNRIWR